MALTEDPKFVAMKMHWVVAFVEVLDYQINDFDPRMLDNEVVLLIVAFVIDSIGSSHDVEGLIQASQAVDRPV